jgi:hypothetical protein
LRFFHVCHFIVVADMRQVSRRQDFATRTAFPTINADMVTSMKLAKWTK